MKEIKLYLSVYLDVQAYNFFQMTAVMLMEITAFSACIDHEDVKLSTTK